MAAATEPGRPPGRPRRVVLVAGASGSGKSRLLRVSGVTGLRLDEFYRDGDDPDLPRVRGVVDWDDVRTWDADAAVTAVESLCANGSAAVPTYSLPESRRTGERVITVSGPVLVAEGIFAPALAPRLTDGSSRCPPAEAIWLDRPRALTAVLRLVRDVREARKPLPVLLRRGFALWRAEPALRASALAVGCRPVTMGAAIRLLAAASGAPHGGRRRRRVAR